MFDVSMSYVGWYEEEDCDYADANEREEAS
jgi:hypothetical protein